MILCLDHPPLSLYHTKIKNTVERRELLYLRTFSEVSRGKCWALILPVPRVHPSAVPYHDLMIHVISQSAVTCAESEDLFSIQLVREIFFFLIAKAVSSWWMLVIFIFKITILVQNSSQML